MTSWTGLSFGLVVGLLLVHVVGIAADDENYVIMIDAGSSGSRIHVHKYTAATSATSLPIISASVNKKVKPGLSSYAKKPQEVHTVVADLVAFAKEKIPMNKWSTTPFHIQATAGLRSITPEQSHAILEVVRNELSKTQFLFQRSWARIIPGADEGINGWLATNYLLGVWKDESNSPPSTTGVVEMGGASIQVTYVPKQVQEDEKSELIQMQIAGHTYYIYTYSYLSYGLQAAELAFKKNAIEDIEENGNPCYPVGLKHSATGSLDQCLNLVNKHLFDKEATCTKHTCSFNGIYQPIFSSADDFLAIENFFYTTQFFGVQTDLTTRHIISVLYEKGTEYCSLPWKSIKSKHEKTAEQELASYCFATAYEHSMLTHALGFDPKSRIKAIREIDGKPIDWELGAVVRELLRFQDMKEQYGHSPDSEYSDIDSNEITRQRITNTVQTNIGITINDGSRYSYFTLISIFIIVSVAIGYIIHRRNKKTCLPEETLANLGYASSKPSHLVV